MHPIIPTGPTLWEAPYMTEDKPTDLQLAIRRAIKMSGKPRDHFDRALQKKLGTKGKPIYDIDRGKSRSPSADMLHAIAEVFELPMSFFTARGDAPTFPDQPLTTTADGGETVEIIQLDLSLSMGPGTIIDDWTESQPVTFDLAFIRNITRSPPGRLRLVTGIGRSMEPTLQNGDTVMIDTLDRQLARQDGIYWVSIYGAAAIKRLRTIGQDRVLIISDNKDVDSQEVPMADLRIEGRAIWAARGL